MFLILGFMVKIIWCLSQWYSCKWGFTFNSAKPHVDVSGHGHRIDFSQHVNLQGTAHRALFSTGYQAVGQQTYAAYSDGASVSGQDISVRHGGGKYAGYDLLHYGGGSPKLDGRSLTLFGYHDGGEVLGHNQILFGSSSGNHLNINDAVVFSAPGGVDIFSNDHIVAHLPANGGSWAMVSDQRIKVNVRPLNSSEILKGDGVNHFRVAL